MTFDSLDYYGDNDRSACAWLAELIREGHLPQGNVYERDIRELDPKELDGFRRVHLFAGIGGWAYALQLAGFPEGRSVWTASCPCQPFSAAGKRKGQADERHLWPVLFRLIRECQPATVLGEQVASDDGYRWLARVRDDLEAAGYAVGCVDLPACCQGSPHIRQRLFWVAVRGERERCFPDPPRDPEIIGLANAQGAARRLPVRQRRPRQAVSESQRRGKTGGLGNAEREGPQGCRTKCQLRESSQEKQTFWSGAVPLPCRDGKWRRAEPSIFPLAHGISGRVGLLRGAGNAISPQTAAAFVRAFLEAEVEQQ